MAKAFKALLLDIEGTTTSISFVKDVLFPYAYENVETFLTAHQNDPHIQDVFESLRSLSNEEADTDTDIQRWPEAPQGIEPIVRNVRTWIRKDKKLTALKTLQGHIWEEAYKKGQVQSHLYPDVKPVLKALHSRGVPICIFSSGSVQAQKLLFAHSTEGDLTPILSGYFDTTIGAKVNAESYKKIAEQIGIAANDILFLTDVDKEALAAREAGLQVRIVIRPGNAPLNDDVREKFSTLTDFNQL
ncbi:Protein F58H1.3 a [Aphelenchoides avenae]|nr:Protein F58H1.3 a [Aphelenchus avenae]